VKIAVLFGGDSMERDVSVATAAQVVRALRSNGHEVLAVDAGYGLLDRDAEERLLTGRIETSPPLQRSLGGLPALEATRNLREVDLVFLALHGGSGEDGTIQAMLDLAGLRYTGTGKLGSALGMDKDVSKRLFRGAGVPTADWLMAPVSEPDVAERLGYPVIVKPNSQGSTVGLSLVDGARDLEAAVDEARQYDSEVMIERYIPGRELTVGVLEDEALAVGEIIPAKGRLFDYEAKYQVGGAEEIFPADLDPETALRVQALALRAARALKVECYCRVDFRLDPENGLWCLEVNTLPGLTKGSLLPRSAAAVGVDFDELCERICRSALNKMPRRD
jgi:D-alanine-D-alanine ligase